MLKQYVQTILQEQTNVRTGLEFPGVYRSTPHAATKLSPAELIHGRKMRTRMDILGFPSFDEPVHIEMQQLRQCIADYQKHSKQYTDDRQRAKPFTAGVGDYV